MISVFIEFMRSHGRIRPFGRAGNATGRLNKYTPQVVKAYTERWNGMFTAR